MSKAEIIALAERLTNEGVGQAIHFDACGGGAAWIETADRCLSVAAALRAIAASMEDE